jgi:hypothetical protein
LGTNACLPSIDPKMRAPLSVYQVERAQMMLMAAPCLYWNTISGNANGYTNSSSSVV